MNEEDRPFHPCDRRSRRTDEEERLSHLRTTFPALELEDALGDVNTSLMAMSRLGEWARRRTHGIVVLAGPTGVGKTVAAVRLAAQLPETWMRPEFIRATSLATSSRFDLKERARWLGAVWLLLDDLGTEYVDSKGNGVSVVLDELFDVFYSEKRTLVVTTNLTRDEFAARYGERIVDRIRQRGSWLAITGDSMRRPEVR